MTTGSCFGRLTRGLLPFVGILTLTACGSDKQVVIKQASGAELTAADIDRRPLLLLPRSAIGVARFNARALLHSPLGQELLARIDLRIPTATGFVPERDLELVYCGVYALSGADFMGVAVGSFKPEELARAAAEHSRAPLGQALVESKYAGRTLYTVGNVGVSILTPKTALFGNETGMRRALDRIEMGIVKDDVPPWLHELFRVEAASIAVGLELGQADEAARAVTEVPLLVGLQRARVLGNFEPPGINFAGTLSYPDEAAALRSDAAIGHLRDRLQSAGWIAALVGAAQPVTKLDTRVVGSDTQFVVEVDEKLLLALIDHVFPRVGHED